MRTPTPSTSEDERTAPSRAGLVLSILTTAFTAAYVLWRGASTEVRGALLVLAIVSFGAMFARASWRRALEVRTVLVLTACLLVAGVVAKPGGTDLWYYQLYGRIFAEYHESAYRHTPGEFANDPVLKRTDGLWTSVRAEYGPVFVAITVPVAAITGTNELAGRLAWQGLAALAVWLAVLIVARRTARGAAVALVGLNPVVIDSVVREGHNDALVGLLVLTGVLYARSRHNVLAALALTAATLVKWPVAVALVVFLLWLLVRDGLRKTAAPFVAAAGASLAALATFGGRAALQPAIDARSRTNAVTPWNLTRAHGLDSFRAVMHDPGPLSNVTPTLAVVVGLVIVACVCAGHLRDDDPALLIGFAIVAWQATALYTSPWSVFWALPVLAIARKSVVTAMTVAWFCLLSLQVYFGSHSAPFLYAVEPHLSALRHVSAVLISACIMGAIAIVVALAFDGLSRMSRQTLPIATDHPSG